MHQYTDPDSNIKYKYIVHISDIHIHNNVRKIEYEEVFKKLCNSITKIKDDFIIVVTGDIVHSKTELSPEAIYLTRELFKSLAELGKIIAIAGNHDCVLYNNSRMSILDLLRDIKNVTYADKRGYYTFGNIIFGVTTIKDSEILIPLNNTKHTQVALYHGFVATNKECPGFRFGDSYLVKNFKNYQYVLLGDIHRHYYLNEEKNIAYAGSLIQQNYKESIDNHGYLLWDIANGKSKHIHIKNNYGYHTMNVNDDISEDLPKNLNIRFNTYSDLDSKNQINAKIEEIRKIYNVMSVSIDPMNVDIQSDNSTIKTTIDRKNVSAHLLKYLKDKNVPNYNEIMKIHETIVKNKVIDSTETNSYVWKPLELEFSNMFSYSKNNKIDFTKFGNNTIIGIVAPNYSGKSSIIDIIIFCLYGKCPRGDHKSIMNNREKYMICTLKIKINKEIYIITRESNKRSCDVYLRKLVKGKEEYINGNTKSETEKKIKDMVGSYESVLSSVIWVPDLLDVYNFTTKTVQKKKEYLNSLFGIDALLEYNKYSKEKLFEIKTKLTIIKDITGNISEISKKIMNVQNTISENNKKIQSLKDFDKNNSYPEIYYNLNTQYQDVNTSSNSNTLLQEFKNLKNKLVGLDTYNIEDSKNLLNSLNDSLENSNITIQKLKSDKSMLENNIKSLKLSITEIDNNIYNNICDLVIEDLENEIIETEGKINNLKKEITKEIICDDHIDETINDLRDKKDVFLRKITKKLELPKLKTDISKYEKYIDVSENEILEKKIALKYYLEFEKILLKYNVPFSYKNIIDEITLFVSDNNDIKFTQKDKKDYYNYIQNSKLNSEIEINNQEYTKKIEKLNQQLYKMEELRNKIIKRKEELTELDKLNSKIELLKTNRNLLEKFHDTILKNTKIKDELNYFNKQLTAINKSLEIEHKKIDKTQKNITEITLKIKKIDTLIQEKNTILDKLDKIEIVLGLVLLNEKKKNIKSINTIISEKILELEKSNIRWETELNNFIKQKDEITQHTKKKDEIEKEIELYEAYYKYTKQDALPFSIIREYIPLIQNKVNEFLETITDFRIKIDNDTNMDKIDVLIIRENNNSYNCKTSSGFENFIISLAFRLILYKISMESKPDILIMDEKWTSIDPDKLNNILDILDNLKHHFSSIIIISHMEKVKNKCDNIINIHKKNGISTIV